jgi:hypothetical protein
MSGNSLWLKQLRRDHRKRTRRELAVSLPSLTSDLCPHLYTQMAASLTPWLEKSLTRYSKTYGINLEPSIAGQKVQILKVSLRLDQLLLPCTSRSSFSETVMFDLAVAHV